MICCESSTVSFDLLRTGALCSCPYVKSNDEIYGETYVIYEIYYITLDVLRYIYSIYDLLEGFVLYQLAT